MKEVLGKTNKPGSYLPTKLVIKKKNDVTSEIGIANEFIIFLDSTKLKIVWTKITTFFKRRVSIIL